ncbi:MAG TPA: hypothetical protein VF184_02260 [Phycisphaeraceae bacterium]
MPDINEQLVQQVVEQVIRLLRQEKAESRQAQVRPPAGVCTGDYSKFPELAGRRVGAGQGQTASAEPRAASSVDSASSQAQAVAALTGIVTAQQLQEAMKASPDGTVILAPDARLTPLANDLAMQHADLIRRQDRALSPASSAGTSANASTSEELPWLWWAQGYCPAVQEVTHRWSAQLRPSAAPRNETGLVQVIRDLAAGVRQRSVQGGLLFVPSAAQAVCYANRVAALRAVVGTCAEAVEQAVRDLGANVLVVEYPYVKPAAIEQMVQRMLRQPPRPPAHVMRHLVELQRDGQGS